MGMSNASGPSLPPPNGGSAVGPVIGPVVGSSSTSSGGGDLWGPPPPSSGNGSPGSGPEFRVWTWEYTGGRRLGISWLGVLLVVVGIGIFINQVNPAVDLGSLFLLGSALPSRWRG
jgi:hypothetical protein